jgi:DNA-binding transcriptional ArsR family regulator
LPCGYRPTDDGRFEAISQHPEVLEATGLVRSRREGRYKFHYLDTTPLKGIVQRWSIKDRRGGRSGEDQPGKRPRG